MFNLKIVLFIVVGLVVSYIAWLQNANKELKNSLKQEQENNSKLIETYENNKKIDEELAKVKANTQTKKDEATATNTKLKIETAKREKIDEKNQNSSDDDFVLISF